jgi:hypothetical protein
MFFPFLVHGEGTETAVNDEGDIFPRFTLLDEELSLPERAGTKERGAEFELFVRNVDTSGDMFTELLVHRRLGLSWWWTKQRYGFGGGQSTGEAC